MQHTFQQFLKTLVRFEWFGPTFARIAIAVVFLWIGFLKFIPYEADSIVPFVANSPFMSVFYNTPEEYKPFMNREGELIPEHRAWHEANNTYGYSNGLGIVELIFGVTILLNFISPRIGFFGALMAFLTPFVTYTFLIFTPETWVPALGDAHHGFPYLSGAGRLVLKDIMMVACAFVAMVDSARQILGSSRISA